MTTKISETFSSLQQKNKKALIPYITPEFPIHHVTVPLILGLEEAGASLIEVGIPFSDPLADGPTIQHSSDVALKNGATLRKVLELVSEARRQTAIPIILMGYVNPIIHFGIEKFLQEAHSAGVDGLIIPDLPPEEASDVRLHSQQNNISNIFLIAPTSSSERIGYLDTLSTDFTYCVSVTGVTGARNTLGEGTTFEDFLKRVKENTKKPFVVGFGIKEKKQVELITQYASGVVVGSALLQAIAAETSVSSVVHSAKKFFQALA